MRTSDNRRQKTGIFITIDVFGKVYIKKGNAWYFIDVVDNNDFEKRNDSGKYMVVLQLLESSCSS